MALEQICDWAETDPQRTAIVSNDIVISYLKFASAIASTRDFLERRKFRPGSRALVVDPSVLGSWVTVHALRSLGVDTLSVENLRMARALSLRGFDVAVVSGSVGDEVARTNGLPAHLQTIVCDVDKLPISRFNQESRRRILGPHLGGHVLCTSGTTGVRKQVLLDACQERARNQAWVDAFSFTKESGFLALNYPLFTGVGFLKAMAVWSVGGAVIIDQRKDFTPSLFSPKTTIAILVPALLQQCLELPAMAQAMPRRDLKLFVAGGFLTSELANRAQEKIAHDLEVYFASTEIATLPLRRAVRELDDLLWWNPTGSRDIEVVDDQGNPCAVGQEGQLRITRTPIDTRRYDGPAVEPESVFRDGYFFPGDMAIKREDGRIRVLGRTADVINIAGRKYAVAPIEEVLAETLEVEQLCAYSMLDGDGRSCLLVAVKRGIAVAASRIEACRKQFPDFDLVHVRSFDDFPRFETGLRKINRRALKDMISKECGIV